MADEPFPGLDIPTADQPTDYGGIADLVLSHVANYITTDGITDVLAKAFLKALSGLAQGLSKAAVPFAKLGGEALVDLEEPVLPILAAFVTPIVRNLFGTEVDSAAFNSRDARASRGDAASSIVEAFMASITEGASDTIEPGDEGAKRIASAAVHAALEGWFNELIPELLGEMIPIDWMHFPAFAGLSEEVIRTLGVGRLVRRAFTPLVNATATTPMQWYANKRWRPNQLPDSEVLKAFLRGDYSADEAREELARAGYTDRRIDMLLKSALKPLSLDDALFLVREAGFTEDFVIEQLRLQGYDQPAAETALLAAQSKRLAAIHDDSFAALRAAYVDRRIDDAEFSTFLEAIYTDDAERAAHEVAARTIRDVNTKRLTASQAEACVKAGILAVADYRAALRLEGYDEDAILSLELLLRHELDVKLSIDEQREQAAADRAAEKAAKDAAAKTKEAAVEQQRALARRGSLTDLKRAVVTGLIPIARYTEVLSADYDPDTVQILVASAEQDRQAYLDQQKKRAAVLAGAPQKTLDVGAAEQAVLENVLTLDEFHARLVGIGFSSGDADVLVATLRAKKADRDAAQAKRDGAVKAAKAKAIDLGRFEQLVRRGARSIAEYDALLASLDYDDASRAAMDQLLQLKIADDAKAAQLRAAAGTGAGAKGPTLEQLRRGVLLGVAAPGDYETYLVTNHFTADAVALLMAELADDVSQADAARQRRADADARSGRRALSLATVGQAARLGVITPAAYQDRLVADGYSSDDVALELELLTTEIADVQATRAKQAAATAAAPPAGLSLAQLAKVVKGGGAALEDYRARALSLGYTADDAAALVRVLGDELATTAAAKARRAALASTVKPGDVTLAALEDQVRAGTLTIDDYVAKLESAGLDGVDVELLASLLRSDLDAGDSGGSV